VFEKFNFDGHCHCASKTKVFQPVSVEMIDIQKKLPIDIDNCKNKKALIANFL
jgi:hypothetical protein